MASDTRTRITKMLIKDSFLDLLDKYPLDKITVTKICEKAEINRVTFYKHYHDTFDLYEQIVDEMITTSSQFMQDTYNEKNLKDAIETVLADIYNHIDQYSILFSSHIDAYHKSKSFELCMSKIAALNINKLDISEEQYELLQTFLSHGSGGILAAWIKNGMKQSPSDVANQLYTYVKQIIKLYE